MKKVNGSGLLFSVAKSFTLLNPLQCIPNYVPGHEWQIFPQAVLGGTHQAYRGVADTVKSAYNGTAKDQIFLLPKAAKSPPQPEAAKFRLEWIIGTPHRSDSKIIPIHTGFRYAPGSVYNRFHRISIAH